MLEFKKNDFEEIRRHGEETYPHECCGVLLGVMEGEIRRVGTTIRCGNTRRDSPHNRYHIDPKELVRIQREGREAGYDIVGFYHSHPDHPAQWSVTDLAEAHWIGCSYVITAIEQKVAAKTNSFELQGTTEEDKHFVVEEIRLVAQAEEVAAAAAATAAMPAATVDEPGAEER